MKHRPLTLLLSLLFSIVIFFFGFYIFFYGKSEKLSIRKNVYREQISAFSSRITNEFRLIEKEGRSFIQRKNFTDYFMYYYYPQHKKSRKRVDQKRISIENPAVKNIYLLNENHKMFHSLNKNINKSIYFRETGFTLDKNLCSILLSLPFNHDKEYLGTVVIEYDYRAIYSNTIAGMQDIIPEGRLEFTPGSNILINVNVSEEKEAVLDYVDMIISRENLSEGHIFLEKPAVSLNMTKLYPKMVIGILYRDNSFSTPPLSAFIFLIIVVNILFLFLLNFREAGFLTKEPVPGAPVEGMAVKKLPKVEDMLEQDIEPEAEAPIETDIHGDDEDVVLDDDEEDIYDFPDIRLSSPDSNKDEIQESLADIEEVPVAAYEKDKDSVDENITGLIDDLSPVKPKKKPAGDSKVDLNYIQAANRIMKSSELINTAEDTIHAVRSSVPHMDIKKVLVLEKNESAYLPVQNAGFSKKTYGMFALQDGETVITKYLSKQKAVFLHARMLESRFVKDHISSGDLKEGKKVILVPAFQKRELKKIICLSGIDVS